MTGTFVNAGVIVVCSLAGAFFIRGIPPRFEEILKKAIGLAIIYVGIKGALDNQRTLLLIMSLVAGAIIGEFINIDKLMACFGDWVEKKLFTRSAEPVLAAGITGKNSGGSFSKSFVSASILFCTGSMAIVGSMQSGLRGNHEILFAKSILDGSISLIFGASMGIGTAFSALPVLIYQGGITLLSRAVSGFLSEEIVREMSAVGSLLVAAIGFNFLEIKEIKVANMIPAVFIPCLVIGLFG
ncbi:MAG: DUF554 domain-containing protein [Spirochaetaceae bacterium]|jgi:uncharacterized membrane protein YqgA involved in biofilm formation|nr:DUF554 domain-containing protein [Spirochaetaceae bacterium]